jgi:hypothetical protein
MSRQPALQIPDSLKPHVQHGRTEVTALLRQLAKQGVQRVYLHGGAPMGWREIAARRTDGRMGCRLD